MIKQAILDGKTYLGIEMGSTRIKAVLIGEDFKPVASGGHDWENRLENGIWTYSLDDVWAGVQASFASLVKDINEKYNVKLEKVSSIGISAMMHGYLPFDADGNQLVGFRTWRNTITEQAANELTGKFGFNIPQRWSIAHLYQAMLNGEEHVANVATLTTLAGYVHWKLTGKKVLGVGEASGVFPIDSVKLEYDSSMRTQFNELAAAKGFAWTLEDILPQVLGAGEDAGVLTSDGAKLIDPSGALQSGCPMCPPEGDAGTGMVATNSIQQRTGNVSAGTSIFAMIVLEKALSKVHPEIDIVTTPAGKPVAMVHCNNCTTDLDAWVRLFGEVISLGGGSMSKPALYDALYDIALTGDADCGGLLSYNYYSGEHITGFEEGRPLFVRQPDSIFKLANFMRMQLFSTMGTLKIGMDILAEEQVRLDKLLGHGGLFKTEKVGQKLMAGALNVPVSVMTTASEGGAWGIALLAAYRVLKADSDTLESFLADKVFAGEAGVCINPDPNDVAGFEEFMKRYRSGLAVEKAAVENI